MTAPLRLLIVAADPLARAGLAALLAEEETLHLVGQVDTAENGAAVLAIYQPEAILLDAGLAQATNALWTRWGDLDVPTLALVSPPTAPLPAWPHLVPGLLTRTATPRQITAALHALVVGVPVLDATLATQATHSAATPLLSYAHPHEPLTPRETEVLQLLAEGLTNKGIAQELSISPHTVKFHVTAVLPCFCPNRGSFYSLTQTDPDPNRQKWSNQSKCEYH